MYKELLLIEMQNVFENVPYGIEHTLRVLRNAETIMTGESIPEHMKEIVTIVAIFHDIGAVEAHRKYGSMDGQYQELEGPTVARQLLSKVGYDSIHLERICYIIGNHHTPSKIDGLDFQILWEADLLDNLEFGESAVVKDKKKLETFIDDNFKTATGKSITYSRILS